MTIGERIKQRRIELGLSQEELSKKMGYKTRNAIYQFEQKDNMKLSLVEKFAEVLETTPAYLMGWEEDEKFKQLLNAYEHGDFLRSITDNEIELLKRIRILEAVYTKEQIERGLEFITLYQNAIPEIQTAVQSLLKSQKHDS